MKFISCTFDFFQTLRGLGDAAVISAASTSLEQRARKLAIERLKMTSEERTAVLNQKLAKLKWDFRQIVSRYV